MDIATLTAAMLATLLLMATMAVHPVAANERDGEAAGYGAPAQLATPDGGPGQFANLDAPTSDGSSAARDSGEHASAAADTSDIVMSGGGPGETSKPFQFNLENINP